LSKFGFKKVVPPFLEGLRRCNMSALPLDVERSSNGTAVAADKVSEEEKPLDWNDPREKRNPKNWSMRKRIFHTTLPSLLAFEM
jgi:hypothetical protein